mgnify:FL=1
MTIREVIFSDIRFLTGLCYIFIMSFVSYIVLYMLLGNPVKLILDYMAEES